MIGQWAVEMGAGSPSPMGWLLWSPGRPTAKTPLMLHLKNQTGKQDSSTTHFVLSLWQHLILLNNVQILFFLKMQEGHWRFIFSRWTWYIFLCYKYIGLLLWSLMTSSRLSNRTRITIRHSTFFWSLDSKCVWNLQLSGDQHAWFTQCFEEIWT